MFGGTCLDRCFIIVCTCGMDDGVERGLFGGKILGRVTEGCGDMIDRRWVRMDDNYVF